MTATAVVVSEEVAKFEYKVEEEKFEEWIETESDRIAEANTMTKNLRRKLATDIDRNLYVLHTS